MENPSKWNLMLEYILREAPEVHKLYSSTGGYCFLTSRDGKRV